MSENISRRAALKLMGAAAGAVAIGGLASLTGCKPGNTQNSPAESPKDADTPKIDNSNNHAENAEASGKAEKVKRLVFYFTGTGNSLYIARQLSDNTVSIPQAMKKGELSYEAEEIGIVYPIYGHMPPNMVREFIKKVQLKCDYLFAVLTYGARKCNAVEIWDEVSKEAAHPFDYISTIVMVDNWLPNFDMNEQKAIDKHIPENLAKIKADIDNRKKEHEPVTEEERQQHAEFLQRANATFGGVGLTAKAEDWFTVTDKCITCGICTKVCPKANYTIEVERAVPKGDCELCFACVHNCPHKAIILTKGEKNPNARYRHPEIKVSDIQKANNQL